MPHHEVQKRPRIMAWLLLMVAVSTVAACGNGSYRAKIPPMIFSQFFGGILSQVRNDLPDKPDPDAPGQFIAQDNHNDPAQAIKSVPEARGMVWIFPARDSTQEMRVHLVCHPQNLDGATYFDVRVEVKEPYTVSIDGEPFEVTEKSARKLLFAAFAQTVQRINDDSDENSGKSARFLDEPVVTALRQLVPWAKAMAPSPEPRKGGLPRNPWANK